VNEDIVTTEGDAEEELEVNDLVAYLPPDAFNHEGTLRKKFSNNKTPLAYGKIVDIFIDSDTEEEYIVIEMWSDTKQLMDRLEVARSLIVSKVGTALLPF